MFSRKRESGAVSLFVVVFAMLLITVVTLSFIRLMLRDQEQAITNDLSQSAYDSSMAGVEDAKRALILYRTLCNADSNSDACAAERTLVNSTSCNKGLQNVVTVPEDNGVYQEVIVKQEQSSNDSVLNQAYTCVIMSLDTNDYLGTLEANTSKIIPLTTTGAFSSVVVDWYTSDDLGVQGTSVDLLSNASTTLPLLSQSSWKSNRPSVMRTQLMQFGDTFTLAGFDGLETSGSNSNTLFLYPTGTSGIAPQTSLQDTVGFSSDLRLTAGGTPERVRCSGNLSGGGYACSVKLNLPTPVNGGNRHAYLRLTGLYNGTHFRVTPVGTQFKGVQPSIDSTGRANDIFRRVETRVDLVNTNFPFPEAAVDVTGSLCKDFLVTETSYVAGTCSP